MRNLHINILLAVSAILISFGLTGCNNDEAERGYSEQAAFLAFLESKKLTEDDYTYHEDVYRVISKSWFDADTPETRADEEYPPRIKEGDTVTMIFAIYAFTISSNKGSIGSLIYTNSASVIDAINDSSNATLNPKYWSTEPLTVKVGNRDILPGIDIALPGTLLGDYGWMLVPSKLAYGDDKSGYIPKDTALYADFIIISVNGNDLPPKSDN